MLRPDRIYTGPPVAPRRSRLMTRGFFPEIILSLMQDGEVLAYGETDNLDTAWPWSKAGDLASIKTDDVDLDNVELKA